MKSAWIKRMSPQDLAEVLRIEGECFDDPWSEAAFLEEIARPDAENLVAVAERGGVAGYVCARRVFYEGHILKLAVSPPQRCMGIGRALAGEAAHRLGELGVRIIYLEVRASNAAALRMYEALGYKTLRIRKSYYSSPVEDAVEMALNL